MWLKVGEVAAKVKVGELGELWMGVGSYPEPAVRVFDLVVETVRE